MRTRNLGTSLLFQVVLGSVAAAQYTQRESVDSAGVQSTFYSVSPSLSADGRTVAFCSRSALVPADQNQLVDVYVRDRQTKATTRVSVTASGGEVGGDSAQPSISGDGHYVAFSSFAPNLVPGDTNGDWDVFVKDRQTGAVVRASVGVAGAQGDGASAGPSISADGRCVAFWSRATNLVPGDTNGAADVFVRDLQAGTTSRVSLDAAGGQALDDSGTCAISADGRVVAFQTLADLGPDGNGNLDVYVRDRVAGTTVLASVSINGAVPAGSSQAPSISADGRFVAFQSDAPSILAVDTNGKPDVFVRDLLLGSTVLASVSSSGVLGNEASFEPSISGDGRSVAFVSLASTLVPGDTNDLVHADVFLRDLAAGTTVRANVGPSNVQDDGGAGTCAISSDGRNVAFDSAGDDLVPGDSNGVADVFVRDLFRGTGFTSLCEAGAGGVVTCPCGNPPSPAGPPGRGCDNSSSTGGAVLAATGGAFLSEDTLAFTTTDERPTAASFLLQGTAEIAAGAVYGQGVRCVTGTLRRLYNRSAVGGSITVPDVAAFDPSVSARSAALGFPIQAGESRWYLVAYRDPLVLGGCPPVSTFNATQTGRVTWSP